MGYQRGLTLTEEKLQGFKYIESIGKLLEKLRAVGTLRDRAGNRQLFFDQYVALLLMYFFNPIVNSLRGLQQASGLKKVQQFCGGRRVSLGSLSEAAAVFEPERLREIVHELSTQVGPATLPTEQEALRTLTAVDGSLLRALPRMMWALWQDDRHHAAKLHLQFEVARGIPVEATITHGQESEIRQLRGTLEAGRLYVIDRGYVGYDLLEEIMQAKASFILRVKLNTAFTVQEERPLSKEAHTAGVIRDVIVARLGTDHHKRQVTRPVRLVVIQNGNDTLWLLTDCLDMPADLVALAYRYRWSVELFFRWLKCVLGCRHLLGESFQAVQIQVYAALIASLLLVAWTHKKPNKRTFEMLCFYFSGWATEEELQRHLEQLPLVPG
jgi:hypothetical protein